MADEDKPPGGMEEFQHTVLAFEQNVTTALASMQDAQRDELLQLAQEQENKALIKDKIEIVLVIAAFVITAMLLVKRKFGG